MWRPLTSWRIRTGSLAPLAAGKSSASLSRHCAAPLLSVCQTRNPRERSEPPFSELVASPSNDNNKNTGQKRSFNSRNRARRPFGEGEKGLRSKNDRKRDTFHCFYVAFVGGDWKTADWAPIARLPPFLSPISWFLNAARRSGRRKRRGGYRTPERAREAGDFSTWTCNSGICIWIIAPACQLLLLYFFSVGIYYTHFPRNRLLITW